MRDSVPFQHVNNQRRASRSAAPFQGDVSLFYSRRFSAVLPRFSLTNVNRLIRHSRQAARALLLRSPEDAEGETVPHDQTTVHSPFAAM